MIKGQKESFSRYFFCLKTANTISENIPRVRNTYEKNTFVKMRKPAEITNINKYLLLLEFKNFNKQYNERQTKKKEIASLRTEEIARKKFGCVNPTK